MKINRYLDYTNLNPNFNFKELKKLISEIVKYNFIGLCIPFSWVAECKKRLRDTDIKVITVPNWTQGGGYYRMNKVSELACEMADEVDYIINTYKMYEQKEWKTVEKELNKIRKMSKVLKVIIETNYVRETHLEENKKLIKQAIQLVEESKADYVKTDSGLFRRKDINTLYEDVKIIKKYTKLPIKAAGGIKTLEQCKKLIELGVSRIGTSSGVKIMGGE